MRSSTSQPKRPALRGVVAVMKWWRQLMGMRVVMPRSVAAKPAARDTTHSGGVATGKAEQLLMEQVQQWVRAGQAARPVSSADAFPMLAAALNLPRDNVVSMTLHLRGGELARLDLLLAPSRDDMGRLAAVLKQYELVDRRAPPQ